MGTGVENETTKIVCVEGNESCVTAAIERGYMVVTQNLFVSSTLGTLGATGGFLVWRGRLRETTGGVCVRFSTIALAEG